MLDDIINKNCFIICPLGDEHSEIRKKSDTFLKFVFNPVLERHGYKSVRADQIPKVGLITSQIINLIIESPLVIADLTDSNPNVFYELAIRHATGLPYIQVITKGQKIPFDINSIRTIEIDIKDLESVERAKTEIEKLILSFHEGHIADSPIFVASTVRLLQNDSTLIEQIADRISDFSYYPDSGFCKDENESENFDEINEKIEVISRKLWGFREYGIGLEDLSTKIDLILTKIEEIENKK